MFASQSGNLYIRYMRVFFFFQVVVSVVVLSSCTVFKEHIAKSTVRKSVEKSPLFQRHFTGFVLYDPESGAYLQEHNADKYFTPASNTKLFTFYAGLKLLGNSIPSMKYTVSGDSLIFWGTGDPTFLHPDFAYQPAFDLLKNTDKQLYYAPGNFEDTHFGAGWAWDDYSYYFQTERSAMPIYGNMVHFLYDTLSESHYIVPSFFEDFTDILGEEEVGTGPSRGVEYNIFQYYPDSKKSNYKNRVPFKVSDELFVTLLSDTLVKPVRMIPFQDRQEVSTVYGGSVNELYAWMLKASDNFLAEQILYLCAAERGDKLNAESIRAYMAATHLADLPSPPVWRDGSGLSRYNLFTPRSMVVLLEKLKKELPEHTLLSLLPAGGVDGTLRHWYKGSAGEPYVFAKTGTFTNNHCLSGYIRTRSGRLLTFSFMHNNYNSSSSPVKSEMEKTLKLIYEKY